MLFYIRLVGSLKDLYMVIFLLGLITSYQSSFICDSYCMSINRQQQQQHNNISIQSCLLCHTIMCKTAVLCTYKKTYYEDYLLCRSFMSQYFMMKKKLATPSLTAILHASLQSSALKMATIIKLREKNLSEIYRGLRLVIMNTLKGELESQEPAGGEYTNLKHVKWMFAYTFLPYTMSTERMKRNDFQKAIFQK